MDELFRGSLSEKLNLAPVQIKARAIVTKNDSIRIAAHRGYAAAYPENTLVAMQAAVEAGVRAVEIDIQFTRDACPVLLHDVTFKRTGNCTRRVFDLDLAEARTLLVNEPLRFPGQYPDVYCNSLDEFAAFLSSNEGVQAFVEIKQESIDLFGPDLVIEQIRKSLQQVARQCVIISYSARFLALVRKQLQWPVGHILTRWNEQCLLAATELQPEYVICNHTKIPANTDFRKDSWQWLLYEISSCKQLNHYAERGVQWVESMDPVVLLNCNSGS